MYRQIYPIATKHIENNTYVDDFVMGTSTDAEAVILYREMAATYIAYQPTISQMEEKFKDFTKCMEARKHSI
ncbi:hypothetical protein TNCV_3118391 [Trichonephila clavipes]|uniref:Uncharacterized protein n=1 Tax=Trichonephila clavipes TaxID=2585209 RepID=A0A8X7BHI0_TRICX|nr:hypothetical protein TNCV_3118391 [Trichonephila clavipes]